MIPLGDEACILGLVVRSLHLASFGHGELNKGREDMVQKSLAEGQNFGRSLSQNGF